MSKYKIPSLSVDACVIRKSHSGEYELLLVTRKNEPFKDYFALPGGFVDYGESPEDAVLRELLEETCLKGEKHVALITVAGNPNRDPRKHVVSIVYAVKVDDLSTLNAADDAKDVQFINFQDLIDGKHKLAFDHQDIIQKLASWFKEKGETMQFYSKL